MLLFQYIGHIYHFACHPKADASTSAFEAFVTGYTFWCSSETLWLSVSFAEMMVESTRNTKAMRLFRPYSVLFLKPSLRKNAAAIFLALLLSISVFPQDVGSLQYKSQEVSELDGIPVLIKHLPDWENRRDTTQFIRNTAELKNAVGERTIVDVIDFSAGTEAVTAQYDAGRLLIVEFASPQGSIDADQKIQAAIEQNDDGRTFYRRVGNYNVVVFDATGSWAASALIDEVKYEKQIHWLGDNPFAISAERAFVLTARDIFTSTMLVIVGGVVFSILGGLVVGFIFFNSRERRRAAMTTFSDAGGMTRLNLDGFTPDIVPKRLLGD